MAKIKVSDFAKEMNIDSKDILASLQEMGIEAKSGNKNIEDDIQDKLRVKYGKTSSGKTAAPIAADKKPEMKAEMKAESAAQPKTVEQPAEPSSVQQTVPVKKKKPNIIVVRNPHNSQNRRDNGSNQGSRTQGQAHQRNSQSRPQQNSFGNSNSGRPNTSQLIKPSVPRSQTHLVNQEEEHHIIRPGKEQAKQPARQRNEEIKPELNTIEQVSEESKTVVQNSNVSDRPVNNNNRDNHRNNEYKPQNQVRNTQGGYQGNSQGGYQNRDNRNSQGGYQNRDNRNTQGGYQYRDNRNSQGGYQNRDNRNSQGGYQNRDGRNTQGGYQNRDNRNAQGGFQNRDNRNTQGGFKSRDNRNAQSGSFQGRDGRNSQNMRGNVSAAPMEQERKNDNRRMNQDKKGKKESTFMNEDGFRGGKPVKGAKVAKLERPSEKKIEVKEEEKIKVITLPEVLTIKDLADKMKIQPAVIIKSLFMQGKIVTVNQEISYEQAEEIAVEYDILCEKEVVVDVIEELLKEDEEDEAAMTERPPVICVMGHVDHGKTSLLDSIRKTNVIDREAGGITQHIGAYVVEINGRKITFLDTPGHEAFTAMRMRGANATDIAILVVAADDGVMPQTVEAINHAKAAGIEIIVAVNKIDKPSANLDRVKQELSEYELVPEDWGGSTVFAPVSAKTGEGIEQLLEMILLTSDILELKANAKRKARGLVIEAQLDKGRGPVATVLVQKGTLKVGDFIACGACHGKVRAMIDDKGRRVKEAGPSTPVEILGLNDVPGAGEIFVSPDNDKEAKHFAETFIAQNKAKKLDETKSKMSLDDLFTQIKAGNLKELNLIIKADVQGSVEAVKESLLKLSNDEVVVKVIHGGVGAINESDVVLASASNAIIIGFNVRPDATAKTIAENEGVDVRLYNVIYKAIEDVEAAMRGMLDPVFEEKVIGHAEIRQIFKASGIGNIAGSYVLDGVFQRGCKVRITHEGEQIFEGNLASLKRFKDDVKEVKTGFECGLVFEDFGDFSELDVVEAYIMVEVPR